MTKTVNDTNLYGLSTTASVTRKTVLVLIGADFSSAAVTYCISRLRDEGIHVLLVSLSSGLVRSYHGIRLRPDYRLEQLKFVASPCLILLPGKPSCSARLLEKHKVLQLLATTVAEGNRIAFLFDADSELDVTANCLQGQDFFQQKKPNLPQFVDTLVDYALFFQHIDVTD